MKNIDSRVVVSCAGGGKTTEIINRLMALLRAGAAPGEILVITFTNKAAGEIHSRLLENLAQAARDDEKMAALRRRMLLCASPRDTIQAHTFHGWFLTLLRYFPGAFFNLRTICADSGALFDESWRRWQKRAEESPTPELKTVLRELSPAALREMCKQFISSYTEYRVWNSRPPLPPVNLVAKCEGRRGAIRKTAAAFAAICADGGKTATKARDAARRLAADETTPEEEEKNFFTGDGGVFSLLEKHTDKTGGSGRLRKLTNAIRNYLMFREEIRANEFNAAALTVCADFARERDELLTARNEMTFDDLEWEVYKRSEAGRMREKLSYRLSARYRHILIDEFQDTSPLQWDIVREWLRDAHGEESPSVFIVGDPKQAIYGFRGGESRLLGEAENFLRDYYAAPPADSRNDCYRCDKKILRFVNAVFDGDSPTDFVPHRAAGANVGGRVEWHADAESPLPPKQIRMRNPLHEIAYADEKPVRRARAVAAKTAEILHTWHIPDGDTIRPCRPEDILILMPQRTHAAALTDALLARGIACTGESASFLESFECADILDLIAVLLLPSRDYALARVLKSPLFSLSDDELAELVAMAGDSLWDKLAQTSAPHFRRARILLKWWQRQAKMTVLPAHDFLSRLFAQGNVFARYRAASPSPLHFRIEENLSRFLDLALQIAGGARPLLRQFLDEVRRTGPENIAAAAGGESSAVRLMSVHAAKGLESPIVILADADMTRKGGRGDSIDIYAARRPGENVPDRFIISLRGYRLSYRKMKQRAREMAERETVNLFYVATTRARRALVIFSAAKPAGVAGRAYREMRRLSSARPDDRQMALGDSFVAAATPPPAPDSAAAIADIKFGQRISQTAAAVHGEIRHRIVALLLSGIPPEIARRLVAAEDAQWQEAQQIANSPKLQTILQNAEEVLVEREFFLHGEIVRPDLVVAHSDAIWIVDYKTGETNPARHLPQLQNYRRAISAHYPARPCHLTVLDIQGEMHILNSE